MTNNSVVQGFVNAKETRTGALKQMDNDHAYIHAGRFFTACVKNTLATTATRKITILTPAATSAVIHYRPPLIVTSADSVDVNFYEGSSGNSGGDTVTMLNRDRNSTTASTCTVKDGVTVTTNGTEIEKSYIPGSTGVGGTSNGEMLNKVNEWVLKPSTLYTLSVTNGSSGNNNIMIELQWYEEAI